MLIERLLTYFFLLAMAANASTLTYSDSGVFSASTPTTTFSGPNESWSFSFTADSNPVVLEYGNGGFNFAYSNFTYSLNGSSLSIMPTAIRFFTGANGGGYFICFVEACGNGSFPDGLGTGGPQLYKGPNSAPELLPGAYVLLFGVSLDSVGYAEPDTTLSAVVATPEPATFFAIAGVLATLGARRLLLRPIAWLGIGQKIGGGHWPGGSEATNFRATARKAAAGIP